MNFFKKVSQNFALVSLVRSIKAGDEGLVSKIIDNSPQLIDAKVDDYMTPLKTAAASGNLNIVKLLIGKGAEVYSDPMSSYPAVMYAAWNKHQKIVDFFLNEIPDQANGTNGVGVTINLAARQGWTEIVKKHIKLDPQSVYLRGWIGDTPLHWPSHNGFADIVNLLITHGADIDADEINWIGGKPLHWASEHSPNTTRILLEHGANVNSRNEKADSPCFGRTPLIHNAIQGEDCSEITELLLKAGADVNAVDAQGKTALEWAQEKKNVNIISVLKNA